MTTFQGSAPLGNTLNLSMPIARSEVLCKFLGVDSSHRCHLAVFRWGIFISHPFIRLELHPGVG
jgi:hypothetical protein